MRTEVEQARAEQRAASAAMRGAPSDETARRADRAESSASRRVRRAGRARAARRDACCSRCRTRRTRAFPTVAVREDNVVVRTWGEAAELQLRPLPHYEIGERLGVFDFERAVKISGSRFAVLRGDGARLQRALTSFMLDIAREHGYTEVAPPFLVRREAMIGTAQLPEVRGRGIPRRRRAVPHSHRRGAGDQPLRAARFSRPRSCRSRTSRSRPCWRREAGAAGKDTRGYIRLHQFEKVEMVRFTTPGDLAGRARADHRRTRSTCCSASACTIASCSCAPATSDSRSGRSTTSRCGRRGCGSGSRCRRARCSPISRRDEPTSGTARRRGEKPRHVHTLNGSAPRRAAHLRRDPRDLPAGGRDGADP